MQVSGHKSRKADTCCTALIIVLELVIITDLDLGLRLNFQSSLPLFALVLHSKHSQIPL